MFLILYCWVIGTESYAARPEWSSFLFFFLNCEKFKKNKKSGNGGRKSCPNKSELEALFIHKT